MGVIEQARERWLQSVIDFVNMDLDQLRPGDWLNLQEDLVRLAGFRRRYTFEDTVADTQAFGAAPWPVSGRWSTKAPRDVIRQLHAEVRHYFSGVIDLQTYYDTVQRIEADELPERPGASIPEIHNIKLWLYWWPKQTDGPTGVSQLIDGTLRDLFLWRLAFVFGKDPSHIKRCPECQTIFYRVRKQEYCTRRCTNRANMREWRQSEKGKARESDTNHGRYQARIHSTGSSAKADRRPTGPRRKQQEG
jgi:hypothetical protein